MLGMVLGAIALLVALHSPAQANDPPTLPDIPEVTLRPTNPQLGDTILVVTHTPDGASAPTVTFEGTVYPTFALGENRYRTLLPTTPLDRPGRKVIRVKVGDTTRNLAVGLRNRSFPTQRIWVRGGGADGTDREFDLVDAFKQQVSPEKLWSGTFARPASGSVSSVYGVRRYYNGVFANDYYHRGVDYAGPTGSPVRAPAAGRVTLIGRESQGFVLHGNTVGIDHGQGVASIFIHLSRIDVREGDMVQLGQVIGGIGATGSATGPNLHWGLFVSGKSVDPDPWRNTGFQ
jgi:murein DD-endopeptidase MepM/ murein hydrolase activator NlpD